jgi:NAD dependent epimerase/dehydratase family enzyme
VRILWLSITNEKWAGIFLVVAPHAVSNKELTRVASRQYSLNRLVLPAPVPMLAVVLGQMHRMLMDSCNGFPTRLQEEDFKFRYPTVESALSDLMMNR